MIEDDSHTTALSRTPIVIAWLLPFFLLSFSSDDWQQSVDTIIERDVIRKGLPGVAVAVVRHGKVEVAKGYGFANVEWQVPVSRDTIFQSGSVGKQITAVGVMKLVEAGKIKLDESIRTYLPNAPESWQPMTVRQILNHTSGIATWQPGRDIDFRKDYTEDDFLKIAFGIKPSFLAGSKWAYSNTGYAILGILISKVSGRFYGDFIQEHVFKPLGMKTARIISEAEIIPHRAAGYEFKGKKLQNQEWVSPALNSTGDGSYYLSLNDFIAWDAGLTAATLLKPESYREMWTDAKLTSGKSTGYGFGWLIDKQNGHLRHQHAGEWQGFTSFIHRYPDSKLSVLILCNCSSGNVLNTGSKVSTWARSIALAVAPELKVKSKD